MGLGRTPRPPPPTTRGTPWGGLTPRVWVGTNARKKRLGNAFGWPNVWGFPPNSTLGSRGLKASGPRTAKIIFRQYRPVLAEISSCFCLWILLTAALPKSGPRSHVAWQAVDWVPPVVDGIEHCIAAVDRLTPAADRSPALRAVRQPLQQLRARATDPPEPRADAVVAGSITAALALALWGLAAELFGLTQSVVALTRRVQHP